VVVLPSCPLELITTVLVVPVGVTPDTPARYAAVWVPWVPIRILPASAATPLLAMSTLLLPVVRLSPALLPTARLLDPVVLS
jgi:hypothetical protein